MTELLPVILALAAAGLGAAQWRSLRCFAALRSNLLQTLHEVQEKHEEMTAQNALDQNANFLRLTLSALGPPRLAPDGLYFGARRINGDNRIVDEVRNRFGGAATIFMVDERIATNVMARDGSRAVGTRLTSGVVHEHIFQKHIAFRGAATILEEPYIAIYEPILVEDSVIGILFVGIPKSAVSHANTSRNINVCIEKLREVAGLQADAAEQAMRLRQDVEDERRKQEAAHRSERERYARTQSVVVDAVAHGLQQVEIGDLTFRLAAAFPSEYKKMRSDFNQTVERLHNTMTVIVGNTNGILVGAGHIHQNTDAVLTHAAKQAARLKATAASMNALLETVVKTANGAEESRNIVAIAKAAAERSGHVVQETISAMKQIETSSRQIESIIGVIDDIAFQTNLLALNAGVEAARAGESGRGFAVVATEVRSLAQRSAQAAKEIKSLIASSGKQVASGVKLVGETRAALDQIIEQVININGVVTEIAASAQGQAAGLNEVNDALAHVDRSSQQSAARLSEVGNAIEMLSGQAQKLADLVGYFKIHDAEDSKQPHFFQTEPQKTPAPSPPSVVTCLV